MLDASILEGSKQVLPAASSGKERSNSSPDAYAETAAAADSRSSLSDRLQEIRRRAVDDDISRPFRVDVDQESKSVVRGSEPSVARRSLSKEPTRVASSPARPSVPSPQPTPAAPHQRPAQPAPRTAAPATVEPTPAQAQPIARQPVLQEAPAELDTQTDSTPTNDIPMQAVALPPAEPEVKRQPVAIPPARQPVSVPASQPVANPATATNQTRTPTRPISDVALASGDAAETKRDLLITNRAPALSFETVGPNKIKIGQEAEYRVTMINSGQVDARNLVVTVQLPAWTDVTGHSASTGGPHLESDSAQNTLVRWHINELPTNGREHLTLKIVPRDSRPFDLSVGWTFAQGHSMAQIEVQEPKLEMSITGPDEVLYGESDTYTITLANPGTGDAEGVILQLLPLTPHQQEVSARKFGTLKAGERKTVALELTAHQAGRLNVQAVALADGGLRTQAGQEVVVRRANLEVAAAGPVKTFAGTDGVYRVRVENTGDAAAQESVLHITLPAGAKYLASNDGGKFEAESGQVIWQVGSLRPGAVRVLEVRCTLTMPGENRFEIRAGGRNDLAASQMVVTHVEALADLKLYVNDPQGAIPVGADAVYEVKIVNRGTRAAEHIQVVGYFSEGIEPQSLQGWRGNVGPGQVVFEPIAVLAAGQEMVFRINARAQQPGDHVFRAEVQCNSPQTKLAHEEWTKYYGGATALADEFSGDAGPAAALPAESNGNGPTLNLR